MNRGFYAARLSGRDRRAVRVGAWLAGPALVYAVAVRPYVASVKTLKSELATQRVLLARERSLVAAAPLIPKHAAAIRVTAGRARERLYTEPDAITATGALSRDVAAAFEDAGIALQHTETREPVLRRDGLRELTIDIRGEGDFEGILYMLSLLEASDHLIRVSRLDVDRGPSRISVGGAPEALAVVATIHAYMP